MLGECVGAEPITPRATRPGDLLLLTKGIAIEGTAILARDFGPRLLGHVPDAVLRRARGFLDAPGLSVVRDALTALAAGGEGVHGLHDPTEGGIAQGVREMAEAAGVGFRVRPDAIPIFEETRTICDALAIDPLRLLASGALLVTIAPDRAEEVRAALASRGIASAVIGVAVATEGVTVEQDGGSRAWPLVERDELARLLDAPPAYTLLYDGDCAFCRAWVERIRVRDTRHRLALVPFQSVDPASYGVRRADLEEAMHLVGPDGVWRGAAAAREVLALLPRWRWAAWLFRIPFVLPIAQRVYDWIARRRHRRPCGSGVCRRGGS
jgi:predicted DCC family thiol-disulfide oxidoreductase YuxK